MPPHGAPLKTLEIIRGGECFQGDPPPPHHPGPPGAGLKDLCQILTCLDFLPNEKYALSSGEVRLPARRHSILFSQAPNPRHQRDMKFRQFRRPADGAYFFPHKPLNSETFEASEAGGELAGRTGHTFFWRRPNEKPCRVLGRAVAGRQETEHIFPRGPPNPCQRDMEFGSPNKKLCSVQKKVCCALSPAPRHPT